MESNNNPKFHIECLDLEEQVYNEHKGHPHFEAVDDDADLSA